MKKLYHGSKNRFEKFSYDFIREHGTNEGVGFYLTNNEQIAMNYGTDGYLYEFELKAGKELSSTERKLTDAELRKLLIALDEKGEILSNWGDVNWDGQEKILRMAIENISDDTDDMELISGLCTTYGGFEDVLTTLHEELGYTHTRVEADWGEQEIYVVFTNDCIELKGVYTVENK